jgi:uncharacterized linocin/CFP29 family protein
MPFDNIMQGDFVTLNSENGMLAKRPYIATSGRHAGQAVVTVNTGKRDQSGNLVYAERPINANATLRKDEWIDLDDTIIEAARERLVIVDDLISAGLTYNVGGLGTMIAEWETGSEVTDARISMDGDTVTERDRQEFGLNGVPIPLIHKDWKISERALLASRTRGAALDVTTGQEMARAVARTSEAMIFNGASLSTGGYSIPGLTTYSGRETFTISDWSASGTTPETILAEILAMVAKLETNARAYGPFNIYIPAAYSAKFYQDFKANSDKTLMDRVLEDPRINAVRVADALATGNVSVVEMTSRNIDLAIASDVTNVQWQSGSGMTNMFKTYAAWAPRIKSDFDGRCGILHGSL